MTMKVLFPIILMFFSLIALNGIFKKNQSFSRSSTGKDIPNDLCLNMVLIKALTASLLLTAIIADHDTYDNSSDDYNSTEIEPG